VEVHLGAVEAHSEALEAHPSAMEAHSGATEAHPVAIENHPGAIDAQLEPWRPTLEPRKRKSAVMEYYTVFKIPPSIYEADTFIMLFQALRIGLSMLFNIKPKNLQYEQLEDTWNFFFT
jgi:hypothetical protein